MLRNDSDPDGDDLTVTLLEAPFQGAFQLNPDGSFEYTPNQNSSGLDGFSYEVSDGELTSGEVIVAITITTSNDVPVAADDNYTMEQGATLVIINTSGVLANDSDPDGDALTATVVTQPSNGTVNLASDGAFTYQPNAEFSGTDTFTYSANDGSTSSDATVTIQVNNPNAFEVASTAVAGTSIGVVDPVQDFGDDVVYQFDAQIDDRLRLRPDDHISGSATASVVLVEYLDFECPACRAYHPLVASLKATYPDDLMVVSRHLPLEDIHPHARAAARASEAAADQGMFDEMADLLFDGQPEWSLEADPTGTFEGYATQLGLDLDAYRAVVSDPATDVRITSDFTDAVQLGAAGTPSFFLQGERIASPDSLEAFEQVIQTEVDNLSDEAIAVNYQTGELIVRNGAALAALGSTSATKSVLVADGDGLSETVDVVVTPVESGSGEPPFAFAVDNAVEDEDDWLI